MSTNKNKNHGMKNSTNDILKKLRESRESAEPMEIKNIDPKDINGDNENINISGDVISNNEIATEKSDTGVIEATIGAPESKTSSSIYEKFLNADNSGQVVNIPITNLIPAPTEWNFYSPLSVTKKLELMDSISDKGLLHPIVVWERDNGVYMILSGHNRVKAYSELYEVTKDTKYKEIRAAVKRKDEITEEDAQGIIIDTNWVSRQLSPMEKSKSIYRKYIAIKQNNRQQWYTGTLRDKISQYFNISGRQIDQYIKLNNLIDEFKALIEEGKISIKSGSKVASLPEEIQKWIYDTFKDCLSNKILEKLTADMVKKDIAALFQYQQNITEKLSLKVQTQDKQQVQKLISETLAEHNIYMEWTI